MAKWDKNVRKVVPYVPGEQPEDKGIIKLNTNENPYPPAPGVARILREFDVNMLRLYPDSSGKVLVEALAGYYNLDSEQVFVGVGSDDVLAMSFLTFFNSKNPILFPDITYSFYDVWADLYRIPYQCQPLDENFRIRKEDYFIKNGGIILANPNAPTGKAADLEVIREILDRNQEVIVIIDEAYIDFGGESAVSLIPEYGNLLVVQTFSKSRSMAGMRIGYALGQPEIIKYLNDVKYSFNSYTMDQTALYLGAEAVKDDAYYKDILNKIINTRERVAKEMKELGFTFSDSDSNFIFVTHPKWQAAELFRALRAENIYVRYFNKARIDNYLRITIGTDEEMNTLLHFLRSYSP